MRPECDEQVQNGKEKVGISVQHLELTLALSEEPMAMSIKMPRSLEE